MDMGILYHSGDQLVDPHQSHENLLYSDMMATNAAKIRLNILSCIFIIMSLTGFNFKVEAKRDSLFITRDTSFVVPADIAVRVDCWGSGGGGGGRDVSFSVGTSRGGGGGGYSFKETVLRSGDVIDVYIGNGGKGGFIGSFKGYNGYGSYLKINRSTLVQALGGIGGEASILGPGGLGGNTSNAFGSVKYAGGNGFAGGGGAACQDNNGFSSDGVIGGIACGFGGAGADAPTSGDCDGNPGKSYGGGGSGAIKSTPDAIVKGGDGADGLIIISWERTGCVNGSISGSSICYGDDGQLTFTATEGTDPFTVIYTDGSLEDTVENVFTGVPFNVCSSPSETTEYSLISVVDINGCSRSDTEGFIQGSATITVASSPEPPVSGLNEFIYDGTEKIASVSVEDGNSVQWYNAETGGELLPDGLKATNAGSYSAWVEAVGSVTGCVSNSRTEVKLVIHKKDAAIEIAKMEKVYGDEDPQFEASVSGFLESDNIQLSFDRDTGETVTDYPYAVTVAPGPEDIAINYNISIIPGTLTILPKPVIIEIGSVSKAYGDVDPDLSVSAIGFLEKDEMIVSCQRDPGENVGGSPYKINVVLTPVDVSKNYSITLADNDFIIYKRKIEITANDQSKEYNDPDPELTYSITDGKLFFNDLVSGSLFREPGESMGVYSIRRGNLSLNDNYELTFIEGKMEINPANVDVISWPEATSIEVGQTLADSRLIGGVASVDGAFSFVNLNAIPPEGIYMARVRYKPDDPNYSAVENDIALNVIEPVPISIVQLNEGINRVPEVIFGKVEGKVRFILDFEVDENGYIINGGTLNELNKQLNKGVGVPDTGYYELKIQKPVMGAEWLKVDAEGLWDKNDNWNWEGTLSEDEFVVDVPVAYYLENGEWIPAEELAGKLKLRWYASNPQEDGELIAIETLNLLRIADTDSWHKYEFEIGNLQNSYCPSDLITDIENLHVENLSPFLLGVEVLHEMSFPYDGKVRIETDSKDDLQLWTFSGTEWIDLMQTPFEPEPGFLSQLGSAIEVYAVADEPAKNYSVSFYLFDVDGDYDADNNLICSYSLNLQTNVLPSATISGTRSVCDGDKPTITVELTGTAPWTFTWSDGSDDFTVENTYNNFHEIEVFPEGNTTYTLKNVADASGCGNEVNGVARLYFSPVTKIPEVKASPNTEIDIPIIVNSFSDVRDISLTLKYDPDVMDFTSITNGDILFGQDEYNDIMVNVVPLDEYNLIRVSYIGHKSVTLDDESILLWLSFNYKNGNTSLEWVDSVDEHCEYSYVSIDDETGFESFAFCDDPSESFYINGVVRQLGGFGTNIADIADISTLTATPAIVPVSVIYPDLETQEIGEDVLSDLSISIDGFELFPEETKVFAVELNGESILPSPVEIGGKSTFSLAGILGNEAETLISHSGKTDNYKFYFSGIMQENILPLNVKIHAFTDMDADTAVLDVEGVSLSFRNAEMLMKETVEVCGVEPLPFTVQIKYPTIMEVDTMVKTDFRFTFETSLPAATVINYSNNSSHSGIYTLSSERSMIMLSDIVGNPPEMLQGKDESEIWTFEISNAGVMADNIVSVDAVAVLGDEYFNYVSGNVSLTVLEGPQVSLLLNGHEVIDGKSLEFCYDENIEVKIQQVSGVAPYIVSWMVNNGDEQTASVDDGGALFSDVLPSGNYEIRFTSLTDATGCELAPAELNKATILVNEKPEVLVSKTDITCFGAGNGSVTFSPGNESFFYSYTLEPGNLIVEHMKGVYTFEGLDAGKYTWSVVDENTGCSITDTVIVHEPESISLLGSVNYYNQFNSALGDVALTLIYHDSKEIIAQVKSDADGHYVFENVCPGIYDIVLNSQIGIEAVNSTDAGQVNAWNVARSQDETYPEIEKVRFMAGDVNGDNIILSQDASLIQEYFVTLGASVDFDNNWEFWKAEELVSTQPQFIDTITIDIPAESSVVQQDFLGMISGDFNRSYKPSVFLKSGFLNSGSVRILTGGQVTVAPDAVIDIPVRVKSPMEIGAASLIMEYPEMHYQIERVFLKNDSGNDVMYHAMGGELRIGWFAGSPLFLNEGDTLFMVRIAIQGINSKGVSTQFNLANDPLVEIADRQFVSIPDVVLEVDEVKIENIAVGVNEPGSDADLSLRCYPVPFSDNTTIKFSIPEDGEVCVDIVGMQGIKICNLLNNNRMKGDYVLEFDGSNLLPGIYQAILTHTSKNGGVKNESVRLVKQ